ncbi:hypothetical protein BDV93DRAFT_525025, partial [Ceratobasidium sp. AG-I]
MSSQATSTPIISRLAHPNPRMAQKWNPATAPTEQVTTDSVSQSCSPHSTPDATASKFRKRTIRARRGRTLIAPRTISRAGPVPHSMASSSCLIGNCK